MSLLSRYAQELLHAHQPPWRQPLSDPAAGTGSGSLCLQGPSLKPGPPGSPAAITPPLPPNTPQELVALVAECLDPFPKARPTAAQVLSRLDAACAQLRQVLGGAGQSELGSWEAQEEERVQVGRGEAGVGGEAGTGPGIKATADHSSTPLRHLAVALHALRDLHQPPATDRPAGPAGTEGSPSSSREVHNEGHTAMSSGLTTVWESAVSCVGVGGGRLGGQAAVVAGNAGSAQRSVANVDHAP